MSGLELTEQPRSCQLSGNDARDFVLKNDQADIIPVFLVEAKIRVGDDIGDR
jgi:hypothetical protein